MKGSTGNLYRQVRQKEARDTRMKEWKNIMDPNYEMGQKLTAAKKYFYAFEFQLWTAQGSDNEELREKLKYEAVREFFQRVNDEVINYIGELPVRGGTEDISNKDKAFYALATTLHFENPEQLHTIEQYPDTEKVTMLSIIEEALEARKNGFKTNKLQQLILDERNLETTRRLLNARLDFLTALGVNDVITKDEMGAKDMWDGFLFLITKGSYGSLQVDSKLESQNIYTQKRVVTYLDGALKTKEILDKFLLEYKLDKVLTSTIKNLSTPTEEGIQSEQTSEVYNLLDALSQ